MYSSQSSNPIQPEWRLPSPHQQLHPSISPSSGPSSFSGAPVPTPDLNFEPPTWRIQDVQQQQHFSGPPLPPRPFGTAEPSYGHTHFSLNTETPGSISIPSPAADPACAQQQTAASATSPPPLPSIPVAYQQQGSETWQQQQTSLTYPSSSIHARRSYSSSVPVPPPLPEKSDFASLQPASWTSDSLSAQQQPPPPVPPKTGATVISTGSSALGHGTPSDWEHLSPRPAVVNDDEAFPLRKESTPLVPTFEPQPIECSLASPNLQLNSQPYPSKQLPALVPVAQIPTAETQETLERAPSASPASSESLQGLQIPADVTDADSFEINCCTNHVHDTTKSTDGSTGTRNSPVRPEPRSSVESSLQGTHPHDAQSPVQHQSPATQETQASLSQGLPIVHDAGMAGTALGSEIKAAAVQPKLDPYEDLDPWSRSSLARYVTMLRKEAVADSDEERFKIFTAFVTKETKLREILYSIENASKDEERPTQRPDKTQLPVRETNSAAQTESCMTAAEQSDYQNNLASAKDNFESESYSSGMQPTPSGVHTPALSAPQRSTSRASSLQALKSSSECLDDYSLQLAKSTSIPVAVGSQVRKQKLEPLTTNPPQPIYTPFRYAEGPQRGSDKLTFDRPAYQAYSALRQASAESGRVMANPSALTSTRRENSVPPVSEERDETFIDLIKAKSVAYDGTARRKTPSSLLPPVPLRYGPRDLLDVLRSIVSTPLAKQSESPWHITTQKNLEKFSADFSYIQETRVSWEAAAEGRRESLNKERKYRQEESEQSIDTLFNGKKIGYADINTLEEEFRQTEARAQLSEERRELGDFIANVFDPLDRRLEKEISALQDHYNSALSQLDHESSKIKGSTMDRYNLSYTMKLVSDISQRLEDRYHRRFEIALDREQRRKKAERRPLVFMGDSLALKQLDEEFDRMEKRNIVEVTRGRDERANRLMDSFDHAVVHGLGENQSMLDEVSMILDAIDPTIMQSSGVSDSEMEQMLSSAFTMVESLRQNSESILRSFGTADAALNDADYSVSVAEARYSSSDPEVFHQLSDEKKKEDTKIWAELMSKLRSVRKGPAEITAKINKLLSALGKDQKVELLEPFKLATGSHPGDRVPAKHRQRMPSIIARAADNDPKRQERFQKALEDAKKRNATRNRSPLQIL